MKDTLIIGFFIVIVILLAGTILGPIIEHIATLMGQAGL